MKIPKMEEVLHHSTKREEVLLKRRYLVRMPK
jgi:hypothetical protein